MRPADSLVAWFDGHPSVVVAFSGGVDSSVVLAGALRSRAESVVAITAKSPSVAQWQLRTAEQVASELGVDHRIIETREVDQDEYRANDTSRCFHCKTTLYKTIQCVIDANAGESTLVSGTNADDLGDFRPGIRAGRDADVQTPLADLGLGKDAVREIAREFALSNAELPASPCLASRIAYGVEVTAERLCQIERAESWLRSHDMNDLRVRMHDGDLARIEVPTGNLSRFAQVGFREQLVTAFREFGFRYITLDLEGLSSGSMNRPLVSLNIEQAT